MSPIIRLATRSGRRGIRAWHGSPYRFDKFDEAAIGSGEGTKGAKRGPFSKSYEGHGVYLSGKRQGAKHYMNTRWRVPGPDGKMVRSKPTMYEVDIGANPERLIDIGAPFEAQGSEVQSVLRSMGLDPVSIAGKPVSFGLSKLGAFNPATGKQFAKAMAARGIPGIRYQDTSGATNYVVFDPKTLSIVDKQRALIHPETATYATIAGIGSAAAAGGIQAARSRDQEDLYRLRPR